MAMQTFKAHYASPAKNKVKAKGVFTFESDARANSKKNINDARITMLEMFGKEAVSWTITKTQRMTESDLVSGVAQPEIDFLAATVSSKKKKKMVKRGII